jgi:hypothetical protein
LYPQYNKFDIISDTNIQDMLVEHLAVMFPEKDDYTPEIQPAEWDKEHEYQASNVVVYLPLDGSQEVKSVEDWLVSGLEYNVTVESGSLETMKYALQTMLSKKNAGDAAISGYTLDMLTNLTVEQVAQVAQQREESYNKRLKSIYDAATGQKPALKYLEVHLGCSIHRILTAAISRRNVLPRGVLSLIVFPRGSKAHKKFLKTNAAENLAIEPLNP